MTGMTMALVLQAAVLTGEANYAQAYQQMQQTGRPLVVLIGADWCPHCVTLKQSVLPVVRRQGGLDGVIFTQLNTDRDSRLARQMASGGGIPQLLMYRQTASGWKRTLLQGNQSPETVKRFIQTGLQDAVVKPLETTASSAAVTQGVR